MRYSGLLGNSIKYSISPLIHNEYYKKNNMNLEYEIFDIEQWGLENFVQNLRENNIIGFNVTIPYKEYIMRFLDEVAYPVNYIGAVNTVLVKKNKLIGYNTDYFGFIKTLQDINFNILGCKALILGSGGAAKAVLYGLHNNGAKTIEVVTRRQETLLEQREIIKKTWNFNESFQLQDYDLVINCTPLGGANHIEENPINVTSVSSRTLFYDLNYVPEKSTFLKTGEQFGCEILNGRDMLFSQAYKAIEIWNEYILEDS